MFPHLTSDLLKKCFTAHVYERVSFAKPVINASVQTRCLNETIKVRSHQKRGETFAGVDPVQSQRTDRRGCDCRKFL